MRGAIKLTLIVCNVIALTILTISVWKLRQDFAGHWHYTFHETRLPDFKTQSLFSNFAASTFAGQKISIPGQTENIGKAKYCAGR